MDMITPGLQLIVRYPDSREDSHILDFRQYRIGDSEDCEVRIALPGVATSRLMLFVEQGGVYVVNLQSPESALLNGELLTARSRIDVGDKLLVSHIRLHLENIVKGREDQSLSPDGLVDVENVAMHDTRHGWTGYSRLLERLAPFISPAEATQANKVFSKGLRTLWILLGAILVLILSAICFETKGSFKTEAVLFDVALALAIAGSLFLGSAFHICFAGRVLLPVSTIFSFIYPPSQAWDASYAIYVWGFFLFLSLFFVLGWCIDYGASRLPPTAIRRKQTQSIVLVLAGLLLYWLLWLLYFPFTPVLPYFTILAGLCCILWPWLPSNWWIQESTNTPPDVLVLSRLASSRWGRIAAGRLMALVLIAMPGFLFLGSLGLRERVSWPKEEDAIIFTDTCGVEHAWFWPNTGRYLKVSDFSSNQIYYVSWNTFTLTNEQDDLYSNVTTQCIAIQENPTNSAPYITLQKLLNPYRVTETDPRILGKLLWSDDRALFFLKEEKTRTTYSNPKGYSIYHAQQSIGAKIFNRNAIERLVVACGATAWPVAILAFWGAVVLWRRGGDSSVGRWIGIWMIAQSALLLESVASEYILFPIKYFLWHKSLANPFATVLHSWISLLGGLCSLTMFLGILAQSVIWVKLCWPPSSTYTPTPIRWGAIKFTGKVLLVASLSGLSWFIVQLVVENLLSCGEQNTALTNTLGLFVAQILTIILLFLVGWVVRRETRTRTEAPYIGGLMFLFVLLSVGAILLSITILPSTSNPYSWFGLQWEMPMSLASQAATMCIALSVLAGMSFLFMIIRGQFLHLLSQNDLAVAFVAVALPFMFEAGENLVQTVFQDTMLLSSAGTQILSITVVVLVLAPAWRLMERCFKLLSVRDLRRIENDVESTLEKLIDSAGASDIREDIAQALARMNINGYAFYSRTTSERFDLQMSRNWPKELPPTLQVSESLRLFLGRGKGLVDFRQLAFKWSFFFHAFELKRLEKITRCHYLLPICLGPSVRGILIAPEDTTSNRQLNQLVLESMNTVGLAALEGGNAPRLETSDAIGDH